MLLIDVGNTKTAFAWAEEGKIKHAWKIATQAERLNDEYISFLNQAFLEVGLQVLDSDTEVVLCSVVPKVTHELLKLTENVFHLRSGVATSFKVKVKSPHTLGADRLADMEAALVHFEPPLIVVDFGTATTLSVLDEEKNFLGGLICPGFGISAEALFKKAAALSSIDYIQTKSMIGDDTQSALSNGVCKGHARMVETLVQDIQTEKKWKASQVVVTGGALNALTDYLPKHFVQQDNLALEGLRVLGQKHFSKKDKN